MSLGYDPKWGQVSLMSYLEGPVGSTVFSAEKGGFSSANTAVISDAVSRWGRGGAFFPSGATPTNISFSSGPVLTTNPQVIQGSFYPADVSGNRFVMSAGTRIELSVNSGVLTLNIRTTSAATPVYSITLAGIEAGQWYDYAIRINSAGASLEVNQADAGSVEWGAESHANQSSLTRRLGNSSANSNDNAFRGYLGPFRWTIGDERLEDAGQPAYRFPVLGAVDSLRESVIFHSRFEGLNNATSAGDTKGKAIVFSGAARVESATKFSGVSSFRANGGTGLINHADFQFGTDDFTIEFFCARTGNSGEREYLFSLMDSAGVDHALSLSGNGFGSTGYLRVAGVDVASASPVSPAQNSFLHYAIVRQGAVLSVFRSNNRVLTYSIGTEPINSNGQFVVGKGGTVATGSASLYDYIDELRITRGAARYNPELTSITAPTEFFSEFGPRSLSGTVIDSDGNPLVRTVRAYHRLTGRLISETISATDGTWSLPVADTGEHFVVVHDDVKNALIYDRVQPVLVT